MATVVLEAGRNEVLLLRRSSKVRSCQNLWACVSGSVEKGENSLQAARRELAAIERAKQQEHQRQKRLAQQMFSALGKP